MPEDKSSKPVSKQPEQAASPTAAPVAKPAGTKTSGLAIAAIILAFLFPLIGLILGIVALSSIKKSGEKGRGLAIASIVVSLLIMLSGIAIGYMLYNSATKSLKDAGINVDTKSNTVTVNKDGESVSIGENAKLPSDVPIYEPSDVVASLKNGDNSYSATLLSPDSISKVTEYYTAELPKNGWQTSDDTSSLTLENSTISTYKKDNRTLGVIVATDPSSNKTSITLSVTVQEPL